MGDQIMTYEYRGNVFEDEPPDDLDQDSDWEDCPVCYGSGEMPDPGKFDGHPCTRCLGTGRQRIDYRDNQ